MTNPLSNEELNDIDAYWRAANYLSVGQIYLLDNPLLKEPLRKEHIKPRLLGHWGTTPGVDGGPIRWRGGSVAAVEFGGALWRSHASWQDGGVSPHLSQFCMEARECEPIWNFGRRFVGAC